MIAVLDSNTNDVYHRLATIVYASYSVIISCVRSKKCAHCCIVAIRPSIPLADGKVFGRTTTSYSNALVSLFSKKQTQTQPAVCCEICAKIMQRIRTGFIGGMR